MAASHHRLPPVIALVGCTGSGKTSLGIQIAQALNTEIISVDSMAVYSGMDIGTAKPSREERQAVPHHLLDVVRPDEPFTAADFVRHARQVLERLHAQGKPGLLVGGTGLYLRALLHGLFEGPGPDQALRARLEAQALDARALGQDDFLLRQLQAVDPVLGARLHAHDHVRILRALEVFAQTGTPLSVLQARHAFAESRYRWIKLALRLDKAELHRRIDLRVEKMLQTGLLNEVRGLIRTYGTEIKPMKGLGYVHMARVISGESSLATEQEVMARDTRKFARRQVTWFNGEQGTQWVAPDSDALLAQVRGFIQESSWP